jgi:hypothetical protein
MVKYTEQHHCFEIVRETKLYMFIKCYKKQHLFTISKNIVTFSYDKFDNYFRFENILENDILKIVKSRQNIFDVNIEYGDIYKPNYKNISILPDDSILLDNTKRAIYTSIYQMIYDLGWMDNSNKGSKAFKDFKEDYKDNKNHLKKIRKKVCMKKSEFKTYIYETIILFREECHRNIDSLEKSIDKLMSKLRIDLDKLK